MSDAERGAGVQQLIERLKDEGVQAGLREAEQIREEARRKADEELQRAKAKAKAIVSDAKEQADQLVAAGEEALRAASRDAVLRFSEDLMGYLNARVERLISEEMVDRELIKELIRTVARDALQDPQIRDAGRVRVELPAAPLGVDELKNDPEALRDALSQLVKQVAGEVWRDGIVFSAMGAVDAGIRVVVEDGGVVVDLTPEAVTELLMLHLRPRFRALLRGIIQ